MLKPPQHTLTPDEVRKRYNLQAEQYQSRYVGTKGAYYRRFEDRIFLGFLDVDGKRVLDLGTGRGRLALMLASRAREVVGIDISEEMIRHARDAGRGVENVQFELGDALKLNYPAHHFDVVSSMGMFPYVKDVVPFLREINRVLQPGGPLAFSVCNAAEWQYSAEAYTKAAGLVQRLRGRGAPAGEPAESPLIPHQLSALAADLETAGFELVDYRSTFFFMPSRLFYWGARRELEVVQSMAAAANDFLGWCPWIKDHGKVLVLLARKRREV